MTDTPDLKPDRLDALAKDLRADARTPARFMVARTLEAIAARDRAAAAEPVRERVARAIAESQGQDPDEDAPWTVICGRNNEPLPWWEAFTEQADAAIAALAHPAATSQPAGDVRLKAALTNIANGLVEEPHKYAQSILVATEG